MKTNAQQVISSEFGESYENRHVCLKYMHHARMLEDKLLKKLPKNLHKEYNELLDFYFEYWCQTFIEFEDYTFTFLKRTFNPRTRALKK